MSKRLPTACGVWGGGNGCCWVWIVVWIVSAFLGFDILSEKAAVVFVHSTSIFSSYPLLPCSGDDKTSPRN